MLCSLLGVCPSGQGHFYHKPPKCSLCSGLLRFSVLTSFPSDHPTWVISAGFWVSRRMTHSASIHHLLGSFPVLSKQEAPHTEGKRTMCPMGARRVNRQS